MQGSWHGLAQKRDPCRERDHRHRDQRGDRRGPARRARECRAGVARASMSASEATHTLRPRGVREVASARQRLPDRRSRGAGVRVDAGEDPRDLRAAYGRVRRRHPAPVGPGRAGLRGPAADLQPRRLGGGAVGQRRARGGPVPAAPRLDRPGHVLDPDRRRPDSPDDHLGEPSAPSTWAARGCEATTTRPGPPTGAAS